MQFALRDIRPDDKPALQRFHRSLSDESRYRRYHAAKGGDLSGRELRYLTEVDGRHHLALVAESGGDLLAVARAVADDAPGEAEVAIVVRDDLQGSGVGARLVRSLLDRAAGSGFSHAVAHVQSDNHRAIRFFQGLGARQRRAEPGVLNLVFDLRERDRLPA